jgi:cytochrome c nitrite reductase small subunit
MRPVLALSFGVPLGLVLGLGAFTFVYAKGGSYMTDRAAACANCHIMRDQYEGWLRSSHRPVAVCNDCHTPPGLVGKYATKRISRADSHYATQPRHHRARLPEMPHGDGRGARTGARGRRAVLVHPLSLVGRPSAMTAAHPGRSL